MSMRKPLAALTLAAPFFLVACGGGGQSTDTAATTTTTLGAGSGAPATAGGPAAGGGSIKGKVTFTGTAPAPDKIKTSADPKCAEMHKGGLERHSVEVKDGGVGSTLVYVKNPPAGATAPTEEALLDQSPFASGFLADFPR